MGKKFFSILIALLLAAGLAGARAWRAAVLIGTGIFLALGWNNPLYRVMVAGPAGLLRTPSRYLLLSLWGLVLAAGANCEAEMPNVTGTNYILATAWPGASTAISTASAGLTAGCWTRPSRRGRRSISCGSR